MCVVYVHLPGSSNYTFSAHSICILMEVLFASKCRVCRILHTTAIHSQVDLMNHWCEIKQWCRRNWYGKRKYNDMWLYVYDMISIEYYTKIYLSLNPISMKGLARVGASERKKKKKVLPKYFPKIYHPVI